MISFALAEDHTSVRAGILSVIKTNPQYSVGIEAANGYELLEQLQASKKIPDIVLTDVQMPLVDGLFVTDFLTDHYPQIFTIALSNYTQPDNVLEIFEAGGKGYIAKDGLSLPVLEAAVKALYNGDYFIAGNIEHKEKIVQFAKKLHPKKNKLLINLSEKEKLFLQFSSTGMSYEQMAKLMNVSKESVYNYQKSLKEKLGIASRNELILYAIQNGIARVARTHISRSLLIAYSLLSGMDWMDII